MERSRHVIIVAISSDIGLALGQHFLAAGWQVSGTYRRMSLLCRDLQQSGAYIKQCDVDSVSSINEVCGNFCQERPVWDLLIVCPGVLDPIGPFVDCDFEQVYTDLHSFFLVAMGEGMLLALQKGLM